MGEPQPACAHALPAEDCGAYRQACRRAGRARDARQRQAAVRVQEHRHPRRRRDLPLLRGLRDQDLRRYQPVRSLDVQLHAARAGRRVRTDHPVEFPAADGVVEDCARARMRQRRHPEACRADSADGDSPRRAYLRGGTARGRRANHHGLRPRRRQLDRRASRYRQGRVHRFDRSRQDHPAGLRRQLEAGIARARRQVAQHHFPRR